MPLRRFPFGFIAGQTLASDHPLPLRRSARASGAFGGKHTELCMHIPESINSAHFVNKAKKRKDRDS